jgi:hypothetical protein
MAVLQTEDNYAEFGFHLEMGDICIISRKVQNTVKYFLASK